MEFVNRILCGCAYGTAFGVCSPSGAPLDVCAFMCMCTAVGRCSPSRVPVVVSMCMCVYGVRHVRTEWCIFRAEVCVRMLAQYSVCAVRAVYLLCVACAVYPLHASGVERVPRTCMWTVFGMGRLSDAPIVRKCACVDVHPTRERAPIVRGCVGVGVNAVLVLAQWSTWIV